MWILRAVQTIPTGAVTLEYSFERLNSQKLAPLIFQQALCPEDTDGFNGLIIEEADVGDDEEQWL